MAIYECQSCEREELVPRRFRYHLGPTSRCPICGTYRVVRLKQPDKIDRKHGGFLNLVERVLGKGKLYHCRWCRLQYYDRRPLASDSAPKVTVAVPEAERPPAPVPSIPEPVREVEHTGDPAK